MLASARLLGLVLLGLSDGRMSLRGAIRFGRGSFGRFVIGRRRLGRLLIGVLRRGGLLMQRWKRHFGFLGGIMFAVRTRYAEDMDGTLGSRTLAATVQFHRYNGRERDDCSVEILRT
jgi:peptidoglycan hydrolase-like protein with peptidoglycan-binding domain